MALAQLFHSMNLNTSTLVTIMVIYNIGNFHVDVNKWWKFESGSSINKIEVKAFKTTLSLVF